MAPTVLVGLGVGLAFVSVNIFPVVTNDSVLYLEHSADLTAGGWIEYGYRQVGYPLYLATTRVVAGLFGAEPLLTAALLQRGLLLAVAFLAWRMWRWWSAPVLALVAAPHLLAYTNFLLIEGLAIPLAFLLVFPTVRFLQVVDRLGVEERRRVGVLGVVIVGLVVALFSLRFTYAVFGAVPLVLAIATWKTPYRRVAVAMLGITVAVFALLTVAMSIENRHEHGQLAPNVRGDAVEWYYAWHQVFTVHPENRTEPDLEEFYDDGFVHGFTREIDAMGASPAERAAAFESEIEAMFEVAGIGLLSSKAESTLHALAGGRIHDTAAPTSEIVASSGRDPDLMYRNTFARSQGHDAFVDAYNGGREGGNLTFGGIPANPLPSAKALVAILLPVGLVVMCVGLATRGARVLSAIGLLVAAVFAVGMGWIRADNLRFLLPTSAFGIAIATGVAFALVPPLICRGTKPRSFGQGEPEQVDGSTR